MDCSHGVSLCCETDRLDVRLLSDCEPPEAFLANSSSEAARSESDRPGVLGTLCKTHLRSQRMQAYVQKCIRMSGLSRYGGESAARGWKSGSSLTKEAQLQEWSGRMRDRRLVV